MEYQQFRVLTLDGGGVRGLSSLYILQALMERVNVERYEVGEEPLKPCQLFDLIAGTSTGGLIAIMLGRLGMDVDECIDVYRRLMKKVFDKPKSSIGMSFNAFRTGNIQPKFDSSVLLEQIADVVKQRLGVEDPKKILFNDPDLNNDCHVFVCATSQTSTNNTIRLRSYKASQVMGDIRGATIVDAALATSAATGLFDPVNIGGELFADGALLANNPVSEAFEELKNIHRLENNEIEDRICCFVSIGTGDLGLNPLSNRVWEMIRQQLIRVLTETENTMERFREAHRPLFYTGRAFRFNVTHGMEGVALDDWNCADTIKARTGAYLRGHANAIDFNQCAKQLVKPVGMLAKEDFS